MWKPGSLRLRMIFTASDVIDGFLERRGTVRVRWANFWLGLSILLELPREKRILQSNGVWIAFSSTMADRHAWRSERFWQVSSDSGSGKKYEKLRELEKMRKGMKTGWGGRNSKVRCSSWIRNVVKQISMREWKSSTALKAAVKQLWENRCSEIVKLLVYFWVFFLVQSCVLAPLAVKKR